MFGVYRKSPRLAQWDGRRRSSRSDAFDLPRVWQAPARGRVAVLVAAALALAAVVAGDGPPSSYRVGEIVPHNVRARVGFAVVNEFEAAKLRDAREVRDDARARGEPVANPAPPPPAVIDYQTGLVLVERGEPITAQQQILLKAEHRQYLAALSTADHWVRRGSLHIGDRQRLEDRQRRPRASRVSAGSACWSSPPSGSPATSTARPGTPGCSRSRSRRWCWRSRTTRRSRS
jgi:hypothetical protein